MTISTDHWFATARFGMFIHWGAYSRRGLEPSWPLVGGAPTFPHCQDLPVADYYDGWEQFSPAPDAPGEWMRVARGCGMQYAVITTKHHDGITLFPSAAGPRALGRDLVAEFVDAARGEGLRVGLYYSLSDWGHPDYPPFTDDMRPYSFMYPRPGAERWDRFLADQRTQLEEILTRYGPIDLLWFDGGWERSATEWRSSELEAFIRNLQPDIVINDRLPGVGDYASPEQAVPAHDVGGWWETCMTMNHSWGPVAADTDYKPARYLLDILCDVAGRGGNLLLNVSPDGDGGLLGPQQERLDAIGAWMRRHRDAIVGTTAGLGPGNFHGPTTRRGRDRLYLLCPMRPQELVLVRGIFGQRITGVRALGSDQPLTWELQLSALDRIIGGDPLCEVVVAVPDSACDPMITVIEISGDGVVP